MIRQGIDEVKKGVKNMRKELDTLVDLIGEWCDKVADLERIALVNKRVLEMRGPVMEYYFDKAKDEILREQCPHCSKAIEDED